MQFLVNKAVGMMSASTPDSGDRWNIKSFAFQGRCVGFSWIHFEDGSMKRALCFVILATLCLGIGNLAWAGPSFLVSTVNDTYDSKALSV